MYPDARLAANVDGGPVGDLHGVGGGRAEAVLLAAPGEGFRVKSLGLGLSVYGIRFGVQGLVFGVWGLWFGIRGLGFGIQG